MNALPMDAYIRVSQVAGRAGDRFQSPRQQRDAISAWAKANGVKIGRWHEDLDQSGGTMNRPGMNLALQRVDQGKSGGVIVARLDRFARTLLGGLTVIEAFDKRGARVVSVAESIDPATPMGKAMLGLLLIMAQWQRDQADEAFGLAQSRAASAGRFPGRTPYGYERTPEGFTIVDHDAASVVQRIFQARAEGRGWQGIAIDLTADDIPTPQGGRAWTSSTIGSLVRSEASLGVFIGPRGLRVEDAWPAIIDRATWEAANRVRGVRDNTRVHHDRLFAGVARCAGCRQVLRRAVNPEGFVSYACRTVGCPARSSIGAAILDEHLAGIVADRLARVTLKPRASGGEDLARLAAARDKAVREMEAWRDDLELRGALGDEDWRQGMLARARARDDAETELAAARAESGLLDQLPADHAVTLGELPWTVRRQLVETMVHSVWVRRSTVRGPGARRHVAPRVRLVWMDDRPQPALPRDGASGPLEW